MTTDSNDDAIGASDDDAIGTGTGWRPDAPLTVAQRAGSAARTARDMLLGLRAPDAGEIDQKPWLLNQGGTQACTGHFGAMAIYGLTGAHTSPWLLWYWARVLDGWDQDRLPDIGVSISSMCLAFKRHGSCDATMWGRSTPGWGPNATPLPTAMPPAIARLQAQKRNLATVPIAERGAAAVSAAIGALRRGYPVGITVEVDEGFQTVAGGTVGPAEGASRGKHIVTGWGWRTLVSGRRQILIVNSWGTRWGTAGRAWLDEARIRSAPALVVARGVS